MRACLVALVLLVPTAALAQDPAPRVHELDPIVITPREPRVMVLLPRRAPRFERRELDHHAVDRIVESVGREPF